jgi:hypothetical protein
MDLYEGSAGGRPVSIPNIFVTRVRYGVIIVLGRRDRGDTGTGGLTGHRVRVARFLAGVPYGDTPGELPGCLLAGDLA